MSSVGMNVGVEEDIKRVQRLGKRDDTGETSRTRPVCNLPVDIRRI